MTKPAMVVAWICSGMVHHEFTTSLATTFLHDASTGDDRFRKGGFLGVKSSPRIVQSRTDVAQQFLTADEFTDAEWLVTIDSDMGWPGWALHDMLDLAETRDWPIIGGLCIAGGISAKQYPTLYRVVGTHDDGLPILETVDAMEPAILEAVEAGTALQVDATGAAFMCIRRDVLEQMYLSFGDEGRNPYPWYGEMIGHDGQSYGEDVLLCLRARQLGFEVWVDTRVEIDHMKSGAINFSTYRRRMEGRKALALP